MPFCENCGYELPVSAAFCTNCGVPVAKKTSSPPPPSIAAGSPAQTAAESIVYSVDVEEPKVGGDKYLLVFTDRRVVAAFEGGGLTRLVTAGVGRMAYDDAKIKWMKGR